MVGWAMNMNSLDSNTYISEIYLKITLISEIDSPESATFDKLVRKLLELLISFFFTHHHTVLFTLHPLLMPLLKVRGFGNLLKEISKYL